jgi:hypothetical protein
MWGLRSLLSTGFGRQQAGNSRLRRLFHTAPWRLCLQSSYTLRREIRATTTREGSGQRMNSVVSPFGSMTFWYGVPS